MAARICLMRMSSRLLRLTNKASCSFQLQYHRPIIGCNWSNQFQINSKSFHTSARLLDENNKNDEPPADSVNNLGGNGNNNSVPLVMPSMTQLAPISVPDFFPKVPLIVVSRNPLFPRFIKMIEVSHFNFLFLFIPYLNLLLILCLDFRQTTYGLDKA